MDDPWKYAVFIWASYAVFTIVVGGLIAWLFWDGRRHTQRLVELERRGVRRRSQTEGARR